MELRAAARRELGDILSSDGVSPLAALRLKAGLSQAELAKRLEMHQPQLSRLESGQHSDVYVSTLAALAGALGMGLEVVNDAFKATRAGYVERVVHHE